MRVLMALGAAGGTISVQTGAARRRGAPPFGLDRAHPVYWSSPQSLRLPAGRRPSNDRYVGPVVDDPLWADTDIDVTMAGTAPSLSARL